MKKGNKKVNKKGKNKKPSEKNARENKFLELLLIIIVIGAVFLAAKFEPVYNSRAENLTEKTVEYAAQLYADNDNNDSEEETELEKLFENSSQESTEQISANPITLLLTGDIMLGRYIATLRSKKGGDFPFTYMPEIIEHAKTELGTDYINIVGANLEGPIVEKQIAWGDMVFRFDPEVATLLKKIGFTTLQLANNHTYNQRKDGYSETHKWLTEVGIDSFGQPDSVNGDWSFIKYEFPELTLGFLGLDDVDYRLDETETLAKIAELDSKVDFLIIGIHWGIEYKKMASTYQTDLAHKFVDAGVDFIWGHHPHVVENSEIYKDATIYYSLGNFVFDQYWSAETQKGLVLAVKITKNLDDEKPSVEVKEIPVNLVNQGEPKPAST